MLLNLERDISYCLWRSKCEKLRIVVMKRPKEKGGKGIPDLWLFLGSRYTGLHMTTVTAPSSNLKMAAMAHFWMGSYLRRLKILGIDFQIPVYFNLPPAYDLIQRFLKLFFFILNMRSCILYLMIFYLISIVQKREPVSPVPGLVLGDPSTVWQNVNHPALPNRLQDLSWTAAHEIFLASSIMHSWGM